MGLLGSNKISLTKGSKSLYSILEENGISYSSLEDSGSQTTVELLKKPFNIYNSIKEKIKIDKIKLNSKKHLYEIEFEDGEKYSLSLNHELLLVNLASMVWEETSKLSEGDEILCLSKGKISTKKIISKNLLQPTSNWDIVSEKYYTLANGIVTRNKYTFKKEEKRNRRFMP